MSKNNKIDASQQAAKDSFRLSAKSSSVHREKIPIRTTLEIILGKTLGTKGWMLYAVITILYLIFGMEN